MIQCTHNPSLRDRIPTACEDLLCIRRSFLLQHLLMLLSLLHLVLLPSRFRSAVERLERVFT
jgi:hypothetical protein